MKKKPPIYKDLVPWLGKLARTQILVVGDIMQDIFIWGKVRRISPEAPVPVVRVERESAMLGGAANVAFNLVSLGVKARLSGVIGRDRTGDELISRMSEMRVDCKAVAREARRPTSVKTRIIAHGQQVVRFDKETESPISSGTEDKIISRIEKIIPSVDGVIISDYAKGMMTPGIARRVISVSRRHKKRVVVDPKLPNLKFYRRASVITPNHYEASEATGLDAETNEGVIKAGRKLLHNMACDAVLITRGESGMTLVESGKPPRHIAAEAREVFDVTGAGDTVISVFTAGLASGMSPYLAACLANIAAGIGVGKLGTSVVSTEELKDLLENQGT